MIVPISRSEQKYTDFAREELQVCVYALLMMCIRSIRQSPVILNLKGNSFSLLCELLEFTSKFQNLTGSSVGLEKRSTFFCFSLVK